MAERAHVTSVEAIEAFRASLLLYVGKARPTLEEVSADVTRTRIWLENDKRVYWEGQVRRRAKALEQAQSALFSTRVSNLRQESSAEQMAVTRAKRALEEAEAKLKILKQWHRDFDSRTEPLARQLEKLHTILSHDLVLAAASLTQTVNTLDAYADIAPPAVADPIPTATPSKPEDAAGALAPAQGQNP